MDKWDYIEKISKMSNEYGDNLVYMMDKYGVDNLNNISCFEAKDFYESITK